MCKEVILSYCHNLVLLAFLLLVLVDLSQVTKNKGGAAVVVVAFTVPTTKKGCIQRKSIRQQQRSSSNVFFHHQSSSSSSSSYSSRLFYTTGVTTTGTRHFNISNETTYSSTYPQQEQEQEQPIIMQTDKEQQQGSTTFQHTVNATTMVIEDTLVGLLSHVSDKYRQSSILIDAITCLEQMILFCTNKKQQMLSKTKTKTKTTTATKSTLIDDLSTTTTTTTTRNRASSSSSSSNNKQIDPNYYYCLETKLSQYAVLAATNLCEIATTTTTKSSSSPTTSTTTETTAVIPAQIQQQQPKQQQQKAPKKKRKSTWTALQDASATLLLFHQKINEKKNDNNNSIDDNNNNKESNDSSNRISGSILSSIVLFGALSLISEFDPAPAKAAGSALSLVMTGSSKSSNSNTNNELHQQQRIFGRHIAGEFLQALLVQASYSDTIDLSICTQLAKTFKLNRDHNYAESSAGAIRHALCLSSSSCDTNIYDDTTTTTTYSMDVEVEPEKRRVSGSLSLACQVPPWPYVLPVTLIEAAILYDLWNAGEKVCQIAFRDTNININISSSSSNNKQPITKDCAIDATNALIDAAMDAKLYRLADNLATNLYNEGGKYRYVEARYLHACETISKVIAKRQMPIVERQVYRVDKAVEKTRSLYNNNNKNHDNNNDIQLLKKSEKDEEITTIEEVTEIESKSNEIRTFALGCLHEAGETDAAHRLATLWGLETLYDEETILKAVKARRKKYIQFEDCLPGKKVPDLISTPDELYNAFKVLRGPINVNIDDNNNNNNNQNYYYGPFGIDAEWDEDTDGAALLQIASRNDVILIDIPALSITLDGTIALERTVGQLLGCPKSIVVGFSCRQDLARLRASPCFRKNRHWISSSSSLTDVQVLASEKEPKLHRLGLSKVCHHYLGKPLDKSEQCSFWSLRPLHEKQQIYAALDAWVCVALYEKIV